MKPKATVAPAIDVMGWWNAARTAFDPREGLATMRAPLDYIAMLGLGVVSFVLSYSSTIGIRKTRSSTKFTLRARREEYLQNMRIYENTHPPLSKLLVTLS